MAADELVDSSFYIDRLRCGQDLLEELASFADDCDLVTCGVVRAEVLRGLKYKNAHRQMREAMDCMRFVPMSSAVWDWVERLARELDRAGKILQITHLIVAASALDAETVVVTLDSDFQRVPGIEAVRQLG